MGGVRIITYVVRSYVKPIMGKKSKRTKTLSRKGPAGVPKSGVSATKPELTEEPKQLTVTPQDGEIGLLRLAELVRLCGVCDMWLPHQERLCDASYLGIS